MLYPNAHIVSIAVDAPYRRHKLGAAFMKRIHTDVFSLVGVDRITLYVRVCRVVCNVSLLVVQYYIN